jgi:serine/threonine protein kinase
VSTDDFLREVQIAARLNHPNILAIQDASYIDDHFVIAMELGNETLADRIGRRISTAHALDLAEQALAALAYAHEKRIIHCDIKPENFILFDNNQLKLADFGFAKVSVRTLKASGSGTVDYIAPEQAMGRPKFQSDVFSMGLVLYRLFSGKLPEWPFKWPMPGYERLQARVSPEFIDMLKKSMQLDPAHRYKNAAQMYRAFKSARKRIGRPAKKKRNKKATSTGASWRKIQWREFQRQFGKELQTTGHCRHCKGPVAESMQFCPWCATEHPSVRGETTMPMICPRCERGIKSDWHYCAWCYGAGFEVESNRRYSDKRYTSRCANKECGEPLMPFMRYCPWCRVKIRKPWKLSGSKCSCHSCDWGIAKDFWDYCAWCGTPVDR